MNSLLPISARRDSEGVLYLHDYRVSKLAEQFETPCYLYDSDTFSENVNNLQKALHREYPGESAISYAAKAYFSKGFAEKIFTQPIGLDLVSLHEMIISKDSGIDPKRVHLHGNNKSEEELRFAIEWGIDAIVVDSLSELQFLDSLSREYQKKIVVWFRIVPEIDTETHVHIQTGHKESKFGIAEYNGQLEKAFHIIYKNEFLRLVGLHAHIGSQLFDGTVYGKIFSAFINICKKYSYAPEVVSTGGGWGVLYKSDHEDNSYKEWISIVSSGARNLAEELNCSLPKLVVEPGRWLIAKAGIAVYKVGFCKFSADGTHIVAVDGGIADNPRPALYDSKYEALICEREIGNSIVFQSTLVGRYCESGDTLIRDILLPEMKQGEYIIIPVSGAYQLSMASNYNLTFRPVVLWVEKHKVSVIQERETQNSSSWFDKFSGGF